MDMSLDLVFHEGGEKSSIAARANKPERKISQRGKRKSSEYKTEEDSWDRRSRRYRFESIMKLKKGRNGAGNTSSIDTEKTGESRGVGGR